MMKKILITIFFLISIIGNATTYYLSTTGSNVTGNGSIGSPWLTLAYACAHATTSGDTIHVGSGTFTEPDKCSLSVGVNIVGVTKETSIIRGTYYVQRGTDNDNYKADYQEATLFLNGPSVGTNGNQTISNITLDGYNLTGGVAIIVRMRSGVIIHDCIIKDYFIGAIAFHAASDLFTQPSSYAVNNQVYNCRFINCSNSAGWTSLSCIEFSGQDGLLIHDNIFDLTYRAAGANGDYMTGAYYSKGVKIYNNSFTRLENENGEWSIGMEFFDTQGGFEIYNNNFYGGEIAIDFASNPDGQDGHYKNGYDYTFYIHDNYFECTITEQSNNRSVLVLEDNNINDVIITRNHFKNADRILDINSTNNTVNSFNRITFSYNILERCGWHITGTGEAIIVIINNALSPFTDINIYNNAILGDRITVTNAIVVHPGGTITNLNIKNNIIEHNFNITWLDIQNNGTINGLHADNNILYDNANNNNPAFSGNSVSNYTFNNNIKSDPLFVSTTDFHLTSSSPAINSGVNVSLTTDYDGNNVSDPPEIGAYEYTSGNNQLPSILDQSFQIDENSPDGTEVGTVVASDPDADQTLEYSIVSGNTDGAFAINDSTGVISVADSSALNVNFALIVKVQDNGTGYLSSQATITINITPTGIESIGNNSTIKVYPNPASDEFIIIVEGNKDRQGFEILNSTGNIVFKGNLSEKTVVSTTNFPPGVYLIKLENGRSFEFKKIIKV